MRIVGAQYQILIALALTVAIVPVGAPAPAASPPEYSRPLRVLWQEEPQEGVGGMSTRRRLIMLTLCATLSLKPITTGP